MHTTSRALSRDAVKAWATRLYDGAVDRKDAAGYAAAFAPDGTLTFGNFPQLAGRDAIREAIAQFFTGMAALKHRAVATHLDGDVVALEAVVTYTRHDGKQVSVPAVTIYQLENGGADLVARDCRIYVDLAPLYAP